MGLLLYRLLWLLNTEEPDATSFQIALSMLVHYNKLRDTSISEMADLCTVSKSTLSKFAKEIGFDSYSELKEAGGFVENRYQFDQNYLTNIVQPVSEKGFDIYFDAVMQDIQALRENIDMEPVDELAEDLTKYNKVAAFGLMFPSNAALDFQGKLAYNEKFIYTTRDDLKQEKFIQEADEDTLIIVFSNSGRFITEHQFSETQSKKRVFKKTPAKVALITSNEEMKHHEDVDLCIVFQHATSIQTHSILYQILMDLVVSRYRQFKESET